MMISRLKCRPLNEKSEITKRLAAWASIFAVCTAFAGNWSMNFEHMPELKWRYGYAIALLLDLHLVQRSVRRFRRAGWL
jgi:magnesium transporter